MTLLTSIVEQCMTIAREDVGFAPFSTASTTTKSSCPWNESDKASASPTGPAPTMRMLVSRGNIGNEKTETRNSLKGEILLGPDVSYLV